MDIKQLTALVTVADFGTVTRAARVLHLVQPAVTRQIQLLEDEVGVRLFERTRQGMVPTEAGQRLVERARRALNELERARAELRPELGQVTGIATVGVLESLMDLVVPPLVEAVSSQFPGVDLRILAAYSGHLQQWLDDGDADMSLLYNLKDTPNLAVVPILEERLWAIAPPDAGLDPRVPVSWRRVTEHPLVLPVAGHGLRVLIDQARAGVGEPLQIAIETNSMHLQKKLVLADWGWSVLPAAGVAADVAAGILTGAPVTRPSVTREVVLGLRRGTRAPRPVEAVAGELIRIIEELVQKREWPSAKLARPAR
jgi:LysR family nitrogen assimilation transcriptional regulator